MPRRSHHETADQGPDLIAADVGARIHQARLEAGMTLAELGGEDLSRSFLSLVENGKSRISLGGLKILADRLGKPITYFFTDTVAARMEGVALILTEAAIALREHQPKEALRLLDTVEEPESLEARALWLRGWAEFESGQVAQAANTLQHARDALGEGDDRLAMEICYRLGRALYRKADYDDADQVFLQGAKLARQQDDVSMAQRFSVMRGHISMLRNDFETALVQYGPAEDHLNPVRDLRLLAAVYSGLSRAYSGQGNTAKALHYLRKALTLYESLDREYNAIVELNNIACAYQQAGSLAGGLAYAAQAVERAVALGTPEVEALARSTHASLLFDLGQIAAAKQEAERAIELTAADPIEATAWAAVVLAQIAERGDRHDRADELYQRALTILDDRGENANYADVAFAYGQVLLARGDGTAAAHWMTTAQSKMPPASRRRFI